MAKLRSGRKGNWMDRPLSDGGTYIFQYVLFFSLLVCTLALPLKEVKFLVGGVKQR